MTSSALLYFTEKLIQSTKKRSRYPNHTVILCMLHDRCGNAGNFSAITRWQQVTLDF